MGRIFRCPATLGDKDRYGEEQLIGTLVRAKTMAMQIVNVMLVDWTGIASAVGTLSLAAVGTATWRQNRALIKAATDEASASNVLVAETVKDRELQWEPWPSVRWIGSKIGTGGPISEIELINAGGGPAIACRLVVKQDGNNGWVSPARDIPAGSAVSVLASQVLNTSSSFPLCTWEGDDGFAHNAESVGAIFAKDVLGTRYRFLVVKDGSSQVIIEHRDRWRAGENPVPTWSANKVIWPDYGMLSA
jgi:hypothetical protein